MGRRTSWLNAMSSICICVCVCQSVVERHPTNLNTWAPFREGECKWLLDTILDCAARDGWQLKRHLHHSTFDFPIWRAPDAHSLIRHSSVIHQSFITHSSRIHQSFITHSSRIHHALITHSSGHPLHLNHPTSTISASSRVHPTSPHALRRLPRPLKLPRRSTSNSILLTTY